MVKAARKDGVGMTLAFRMVGPVMALFIFSRTGYFRSQFTETSGLHIYKLLLTGAIPVTTDSVPSRLIRRSLNG